MVAAAFNVVFGAEPVVQEPQINEDNGIVEIKIPPKNSPEYWTVRSEAMSKLLPLLTKKRAEMKKQVQLLADYLLTIDKATEFTEKNVPVPSDPNVFFELLQMGQRLEEMNIPKPQKRPSWEEIMEFAMQYVIYDGYLPTVLEEGEDLSQFIQACTKKEEYGQKVRKELRASVDQCARMWVYLGSIDKKNDYKVYYAGLKLKEKEQKDQEKAAYMAAHRDKAIAQAEQEAQMKQQAAMDRYQFESSKKERVYEDRQNRLEYQQSLLNNRLVNSGY